MDASYSYEPYRVLYFVCEGESEEAYIQKLNRFLKDYGIRCSLKLIGEDMDGGDSYHALNQKRKSKCIPQQDERFFLIDSDKVQRKELDLRDIQSIDKQATILLNTYNYEDYLALHLPPEQANEWLTVFTEAGHFQKPLHSHNYMPLYRKVYPGYRKGSLPRDFDIAAGLHNLKDNFEQMAPSVMRENKREFARFIIEQVLSPAGKTGS